MSLAADLRALLGELGPQTEAYFEYEMDRDWKADAALLELATRCSKAEADARFYESLSCQAEAELDAVIEHGQELTDFFKEATDADD